MDRGPADRRRPPVVVKRRPDGSTTELNRAPLNARTRVHEYGGGEFLVDKGTVYFSNFSTRNSIEFATEVIRKL